MMRDVDDATIFGARDRSALVLILAMESGPNATVCFAETDQRDLFGIRARHAKRVQQKDQLVESFTVDKGVEETFVRGVVDIIQRAQFTIIVEAFAQQLLVAVIKIARLACRRAARLHSR